MLDECERDCIECFFVLGEYICYCVPTPYLPLAGQFIESMESMVSMLLIPLIVIVLNEYILRRL